MTAVGKDDADPLKLKGEGDIGPFTCKDLDTSAIGGSSSLLAGTCECVYKGLPDNTAIFDPPQGGHCTDITVSPASTHGAQPSPASKRDVAPVEVTPTALPKRVNAQATKRWVA